jgi:hypothetical protein
MVGLSKEDILKVQELMKLGNSSWTREESDLVNKVQRGIARYQPSPSLLNAGSILMCNPAEDIVRYLQIREDESNETI